MDFLNLKFNRKKKGEMYKQNNTKRLKEMNGE